MRLPIGIKYYLMRERENTMSLLKKGDTVPELRLMDQFGKLITWDDLKGKVLLSFHPLAFTSVCTDQMRALERNMDRLAEKGVTPIGISIDPQPAKAVWGMSLGIEKLHMLSDTHPSGAFAKACGNYLEDDCMSGRANILVEDGKVIWSKQYEIEELPDLEEVLNLDL
jgi:peroxiredoxin